MNINIKHVKLEVVFDIWEDEVSIDDVKYIIANAIDRAGYSINKLPEVLEVTESTEVG